MVDQSVKLCHCQDFKQCWGGLKDFLVCRSSVNAEPAEPNSGENLPDLFSFMNRKQNEDED